MISLRDVDKSYTISNDQLLALKNVNLTINEGDFVAITGPSGSGKSTLLYVIGGLLSPNKGKVVLGGNNVYELNPTDRARFRRDWIGFIFQGFELIPYLTALENVILPLFLSGISRNEQSQIALDALQKVGLQKRADHLPTELSGGEQQRVAIARGIVNNPPVILADEPTGNLDQTTGNEIMQLICNLYQKNHLTIVLVTHNPAVANLADYVVNMMDGQISEKLEKIVKRNHKGGIRSDETKKKSGMEKGRGLNMRSINSNQSFRRA